GERQKIRRDEEHLTGGVAFEHVLDVLDQLVAAVAVDAGEHLGEGHGAGHGRWPTRSASARNRIAADRWCQRGCSGMPVVESKANTTAISRHRVAIMARYSAACRRGCRAAATART